MIDRQCDYITKLEKKKQKNKKNKNPAEDHSNSSYYVSRVYLTLSGLYDNFLGNIVITSNNAHGTDLKKAEVQLFEF
jgi:hypothetical protein